MSCDPTRIVIAALVLAASVGCCRASSVYGPDEMVRASLATSEWIIVGEVVGPAVRDTARWNLMTSPVLVEESLYGPAVPGDTLLVTWHARSWPVKGRPGQATGTADAGVQLDELVGVPMVLPLRMRDGYLRLRFNIYMRLDGEPGAWKPEHWIDWIVNPVDRDLLDSVPENEEELGWVRAEQMGLLELDPAVTEQKLVAVVDYLRSHVARRADANE